MKTPNWIIAVIACVSVVWVALATMPSEIDNCTPELIDSYRNDIISYQICESMARCIIEPSDIRYVHNAKTNFSQCLIEHISEAQKKAEESTEE